MSKTDSVMVVGRLYAAGRNAQTTRDISYGQRG